MVSFGSTKKELFDAKYRKLFFNILNENIVSIELIDKLQKQHEKYPFKILYKFSNSLDFMLTLKNTNTIYSIVSFASHVYTRHI